jgi:hypothetical protein
MCCCAEIDLDFTDVSRFATQLSAGVAVLRLPPQPSTQMLQRVVIDLLRMLDKESISKVLWIVEPDRVRVHEDSEHAGYLRPLTATGRQTFFLSPTFSCVTGQSARPPARFTGI